MPPSGKIAKRNACLMPATLRLPSPVFVKSVTTPFASTVRTGLRLALGFVGKSGGAQRAKYTQVINRSMRRYLLMSWDAFESSRKNSGREPQHNLFHWTSTSEVTMKPLNCQRKECRALGEDGEDSPGKRCDRPCCRFEITVLGVSWAEDGGY